MSKELAKLISLQNSSEELCTLEEESIAYDPREKMLSVCVTFSWPIGMTTLLPMSSLASWLSILRQMALRVGELASTMIGAAAL